MKKSRLLKAFAVTLCLAITLTFLTVESYAKTKAEVDDSVNAALERFKKEVKGAPEFLEAAKGVLIMPNITKAGFVVGAQYGTGALQVGGKTAEYYSLGGASLGLQIGAEKYDMIIVFLTDEALKKFRDSKGWEAGVDAEVTLIASGAEANVETLRSKSPVAGFVIDQKGLMGGVSIKGAKFSKTDLK